MSEQEIQQEAFQLYAAVGIVLSAWNRVEFVVGRVFCQALDPKNYHPHFQSSIGARAYWTIESFDQRSKMVKNTVKEAYPFGSHFQDWNALDKLLKSLNEKRNIAAHGTVQATNYGNVKTIVRFEPFYWKNNGNDGRQLIRAEEKKVVPLQAVDLVKYSKEFEDMVSKIWKFLDQVYLAHNPDGKLDQTSFG